MTNDENKPAPEEQAKTQQETGNPADPVKIAKPKEPETQTEAAPEQEENLFKKEVAKEIPKDDMASTTPDNVDTAPSEVDDSEDDADEVIETKGFSKKEKIIYKKEYEKIGLDEEWPAEGKVMTIVDVYPQGIKKSDKPIINKEEENKGYYKKKLMVCFEESRTLTIEDKELDLKYREPVPSVFYSYANGAIGEPRIPAACQEEDLGDNFTSASAKMRYEFAKTFPDTPEKQSDFDYIEALKGSKCLVKKEIGKWKNEGKVQKYAKLIIVNFVA